MKDITRADLFALLLAETGSAVRVGMKTITNIIPGKSSVTKKHRVTGKTFEEVWGTSLILKHSSKTVQINVNYEDAVNGRKENQGQEADFKTQGLKYGEFVEGSKILIKYEKDGVVKYYIRVYEHNAKLGKKNEYQRSTGKKLTKKEEKDLKVNFLPIKSEEVKPQGLEYVDAVKPVNYGFDTIIEFSMNKEKYRIID